MKLPSDPVGRVDRKNRLFAYLCILHVPNAIQTVTKSNTLNKCKILKFIGIQYVLFCHIIQISVLILIKLYFMFIGGLETEIQVIV